MPFGPFGHDCEEACGCPKAKWCAVVSWLHGYPSLTRLRVALAALLALVTFVVVVIGVQQIADRSSQGLRDFERLAALRRADNQERLARDEKATAANRRLIALNHRQALREVVLSRRLAMVAKQRADDAAVAATAQARLAAQNRQAILGLSAAQAQIRSLQAEQGQTLAQDCSLQRSRLHALVVTLAGPHPPPQTARVLRAVDAQRC